MKTPADANASNARAQLAGRIRSTLGSLPLSERKMFGGIAFLLQGNMLCCVSARGLLVRVGKEAEPIALANPAARRCEVTGRAMPGFIMVEADSLDQDSALAQWLEMALGYVGSLEPKQPKSLPSPSSKRPAGKKASGKSR